MMAMTSSAGTSTANVKPTYPPPRLPPPWAGLRTIAEQLILRETISLLEHDASQHPVDDKGPSKKGKGKGSKRPRSDAALPHLEPFSLEELAAARLLLDQETAAVRQAMGHGGVALSEYAEAASTALSEVAFIPGQGRYCRVAAVGEAEVAAGLQAEFEAVRDVWCCCCCCC